MRKLSILMPLAPLLVFAACSSQPVMMGAKDVKISREFPDSSCVEIGKVLGSVTTSKGTTEQAIEDMKLDAARKGANYVRRESTGAMGTSAAGTAYQWR